MLSFSFSSPARSDADGHFKIEVELPSFIPGTAVHFASPDFTRRAVHAVRHGDPDQPVEITLRPVRLVRTRVFETPIDHPRALLDWSVFTSDPKAGILECAMGSWENPNAGDSPDQRRRLEVCLPEGKYEVDFESETVLYSVDLVVPPGDGPLALPDIHLESLAWWRMIGKPAAEIEATDLEGKPVTLADYRGKVVVLTFWSTKRGREADPVPHVTEIQKRFQGQPLAILALHDASLTSLAEYKRTLEPLADHLAGEIPVRFLLDRPPNGTEKGGFALKAGDHHSGRTRSTYEIVANKAAFVIDKSGRIVRAMVESSNLRDNLESPDFRTSFTVAKDGQPTRDFTHWWDLYEGLVGTLEEQFGMPSSPATNPAIELPESQTQLNAPLVVTGQAVNLEGRPIAGAKLSPTCYLFREKEVITGPTGEFRLTIEELDPNLLVKVEAPGLAAKVFAIPRESSFPDADELDRLRIGPTGRISQPLKMSPGVAVTGRVLREGKPEAGVMVVVSHAESPPWVPDDKLENQD